VTCFRFARDGAVEAWPLKLDTETLYNLEDNLLLFFTGYSRSASSILKEQDDRPRRATAAWSPTCTTSRISGCAASRRSRRPLAEFGALMHEHWQHKKQRSGNMSNPQHRRVV
jgi:D-glycero-alpha-D-manno-heptose-7-phosphate kinase